MPRFFLASTLRAEASRSVIGGIALIIATTAPISIAQDAPARECQGTPWVSLEITAGEVAGNRVAESVDIDVDGCVITYYADFDLRAGVYQRQMDDVERESLADQLGQAGVMTFDDDVERKHLQAQHKDGSPTLFFVADADTYRLTVQDETNTHQITWKSPELEAAFRPEAKSLNEVTNFMKAVRQAGSHSKDQVAGAVR